MCVCVCARAHMRTCSCLTLGDPMDCSLPGSSVHEISLQEYWSELPFSPPGDLPNTGIEPMSPVAPALAEGFFTTEPLGEPYRNTKIKEGVCVF